MGKLNDIEKNNPFRVPEGYFEELNHAVLQKVKKSSAKPKRALYTIVASVAAVGLLVLGIVWFYSPEFSDLALVTSFSEQEESVYSDTAIAETIHGEQGEMIMDDGYFPVSIDPGKVENTKKYVAQSVALEILEIMEKDEFDNLDYQIMEFYEDEITFLDSYINY